MYHLATMHSVTDRQTDRQTYRRQHHASSRSYWVSTVLKLIDFFYPRATTAYHAVAYVCSAAQSRSRRFRMR